MRDGDRSASREWSIIAIVFLYQIVALSSFVYLAFFRGLEYNMWNWIFILPFSMFCAQIWPLYWPAYFLFFQWM